MTDEKRTLTLSDIFTPSALEKFKKDPGNNKKPWFIGIQHFLRTGQTRRKWNKERYDKNYKGRNTHI